MTYRTIVIEQGMSYTCTLRSTMVIEQGVNYTYIVQWPWSDNRNISIRYQQLYETKED